MVTLAVMAGTQLNSFGETWGRAQVGLALPHSARLERSKDVAKLAQRDTDEIKHALITQHNREGITINETVSNIVDRHIKKDREERSK